ncbi:MAG: FAD synthetase family protein [Alicyclobacillus sp.]|nr:FAD synthetase family protein [Alicyclobacillus sp.]
MLVHAPKTVQLEACILTIGALDGVHLGHQALIRQGLRRARELGVPFVVYTFDPPPKVYFQRVQLLSPLPEKLEKLGCLGVDHAVVAPFGPEYATLSAGEFMNEIGELHPVEIWEGMDFRFGSDREGDAELLKTRFQVHIVDPVCCREGKVISSTRIRHLFQENRNAEAQELMGWRAHEKFKLQVPPIPGTGVISCRL